MSREVWVCPSSPKSTVFSQNKKNPTKIVYDSVFGCCENQICFLLFLVINVFLECRQTIKSRKKKFNKNCSSQCFLLLCASNMWLAFFSHHCLSGVSANEQKPQKKRFNKNCPP